MAMAMVCHGQWQPMATMAMVKVLLNSLLYVLQLTTIFQLTSNSLQSHFKLLTSHFTLTSQAHKSLQTHFKLTSNSLHTHTYQLFRIRRGIAKIASLTCLAGRSSLLSIPRGWPGLLTRGRQPWRRADAWRAQGSKGHVEE